MKDTLERVKDLIDKTSIKGNKAERIVLSRIDFVFLIDDLYGDIKVDGVTINSYIEIEKREANVVTKCTVKKMKL